MINSQSQLTPENDAPFNLAREPNKNSRVEPHTSLNHLKPLNTLSPSLVLGRHLTHTTHAGLNPLVDAASLLFSLLGKIKNLQTYPNLNKLSEELIGEINNFQEMVKNHGYTLEYILVCRYILCATFDDIIGNTAFGGDWGTYALLAAFNQDVHHQDKFFSIIERALKEPAIYIDLMELLYICLSMGYKGQYRATEHNHYQLEQITNNLYKHIRAFRGGFSKTLSPTPLKTKKNAAKVSAQKKSVPIAFIFIVTASVIMAIFISLSYLMDVISNEAYSSVSTNKSVSYETNP